MWLVMGFSQGIKGFLSFLSAPLLGALSDARGRRPFLLLTVACTCMPLPFLLFYNLWWHVIAVAASGTFAVTFSIVFAYVSDVTDDHDRSSAFGQVRGQISCSATSTESRLPPPN
jgi:MFS family permease